MGIFDLTLLRRKPRLILLGVAIASVLTVGFTYSKVFVFLPAGGSLSPYLVGYYDLRTDDQVGNARADEIMTNRTDVGVDLINPSNIPLHAVVALFNVTGDPIICQTYSVFTNETRRVYVNNDFFVNSWAINGDGWHGAIKVVSFLWSGGSFSSSSKVQAGLKGGITHYVTQRLNNGQQQVFFRQSRLGEVPVEVLKRNSNAELNKITEGCLAG
jgi:hypothetical protein